MVEGLPMAANESGSQTKTALRFQNCVGIKLTQQKIQSCQIGDTGPLGVHRLQNKVANIFWIRKFGVRKEPERWKSLAFGEANQGDVDAIGGSAAHDPGNDHACACRLMDSRRTRSVNSQVCRENFWILVSSGSDMRRRSSLDPFLNASTRLQDSSARCRKREFRSASFTRASYDRTMCSSMWQIRQRSPPARMCSTAACSIGAALSTPPISRSSETTSPR